MVLFFSSSAIAISDLISVNGRLMDSNSNVLNGTYTALFRFYNDTNEVLLENTTIDTDSFGFFTKQINVSNVSFLVPVYLGTTIENDSEMLPRTLITSVPSALYCSNWGGSTDYVPYIGATANVDLGTKGIIAKNMSIYSATDQAELIIGTDTDTKRPALFLVNDQDDRAGFFFYGSNSPYGYDEDFRIHLDDTAQDIHFTGLNGLCVGGGDIACPYMLTVTGTGYASDGFIFDNTKSIRWGDSSVKIVGDAGPGDEYLSFITAGVESMIINGTSNNTEILTELSARGRFNVTGYSSLQDKVAINYQDQTSWGPEALQIRGDGSSAGYVLKMIEYSGDEYQSIRVDSTGDMNFYSDAGTVRMSILDSVARVIVGALTGSNTLSVNGNVGIGTFYNTVAPTNGLAVSGYSSFGTTTFVDSYVQTLSFSGVDEYVRANTFPLDENLYTAYVNNTNGLNTTITLPVCSDKASIGRVYNVKFYDGDDSQVNVTVKPQVSEYIDNVLDGNLILTDSKSSVTVQCTTGTRDYVNGWIIIGEYRGAGVTLE